MKVLVTGGTGYIGSLLVPELKGREHEVKVLDIGWFETDQKSVDFVKMDFRNLSIENLKGFDCIIHLAGLSNDPTAELFQKENYDINSSGTVLLATKAKEAKVKKFIYASTCSVYGYTKGDTSSKEWNIPAPKFPYGISKYMAEAGLESLQDNFFLVTILRKGTVGGYAPRMRFDLVVNTMTKSALTAGKVVVKNASLWRPVVDVRDVVKAYVLCIEKEVIGVHNVVQGSYTIKEIGETVRDTLVDFGKEVELEVYDIPDLRNYKASGDLLLERAGFQAKYSIGDTVKSITDKLEVLGDLTQKKYYNIEVMKENGI